MSAYRSAFWPPLWLISLATAAFACSEASTGPTADAARELTEMRPADTVAGVDQSLAVDVTRPMKISAGVAFVGEVVPAPVPCLQLFNSEIKGTATHLGRFEGVGSTCILEIVAPDPDPPYLAPGPPPYATATFSNPLWVLTAANGDELWLETPHAVCVISLADNSLRCEREEGEPPNQFVVGGTGRFAGATGELNPEAINQDGQGPDDFESHGWIRY